MGFTKAPLSQPPPPVHSDPLGREDTTLSDRSPKGLPSLPQAILGARWAPLAVMSPIDINAFNISHPVTFWAFFLNEHYFVPTKWRAGAIPTWLNYNQGPVPASEECLVS